MKPYYTKKELSVLAKSCNTFLDLIDLAKALKYLSSLGENINLTVLNELCHLRVRELLRTNED